MHIEDSTEMKRPNNNKRKHEKQLNILQAWELEAIQNGTSLSTFTLLFTNGRNVGSHSLHSYPVLLGK